MLNQPNVQRPALSPVDVTPLGAPAAAAPGHGSALPAAHRGGSDIRMTDIRDLATRPSGGAAGFGVKTRQGVPPRGSTG